MSELVAIILAAGKGTRMRSKYPKVLHKVGGKPMLQHVIDAASAAGADKKVVIVGHEAELVEAMVGNQGTIALQAEQLGTGHAVMQTADALKDFHGTALILCGDTPLLDGEELKKFCEAHQESGAAATVLTAIMDDPFGYGRIVRDANGNVQGIVEQKDATEEQKAIKEINTGIYCMECPQMFDVLATLTNDNAQGEYYLPDVATGAIGEGKRVRVIETSAAEVAGINSRAELAAAEAQWQAFKREEAMAGGASLRAPETVWFSWDTEIGRDVTVEPNVVFGPGVRVADGATIRAFSHIEGASIGAGCEVGPYARLRPGAVLEDKAKVGNFVEVKKAVLGKGAKANHLSYIGDAIVGAGANIGAGTITCNYDGYFKYQTEIGENAFIGSNSALVAPVKIGRDAIVAAGSTVTRDVMDGELRLVRAEQSVKPGWADRFHDAMRKKKAAEKKA